MKTVRVTLALVGVVILMILVGIAWDELDRRRQRDEDVLRDSLTVARAQSATWQRTAQERAQRYLEAKVTLDNLLRQPPRTVNVTRVRVDTVTGIVDTSVVPFVPLVDFDTLAERCRAAVTSCDSLVAAKDSVHAADSAQLRLTTELWHKAEAATTRERRRGWLRTVRDIGIGLLAGRAMSY